MDYTGSQPQINLQSSNFQEDLQRNMNYEYDQKINKFTFQQIEMYLQSQYGVTIPAIVFEYSSTIGKDLISWDFEDLYEFFCHFGEIVTLEIHGKVSYILFKTFFDANTAREFLQNGSNFKDNEKNNFSVRWFIYDDINYLSEEMKSRINSNFPQKIFDGNNAQANFMVNSNFDSRNNLNMIQNTQQMKMNPMMNGVGSVNPNMTNQMNYPGTNLNNFYMMNDRNNKNLNGIQSNNNMGNIGNINNLSNLSRTMNNLNNNNLNNNVNTINNNVNSNIKSINQNTSTNHNNTFSNNNKNSNKIIDERKNSDSPIIDDRDELINSGLGGKKNSISSNSNSSVQNGKYTCRFEIQIENDKEFQVARRLIGAKVKIKYFIFKGM